MDSRVLIGDVTTMTAVVERTLAAWRLSVWMFGAFAAIAMALVISGIFGVVALDCTQRAREFALRVALGARIRDIVQRVFVSAVRLALPGLIVGLLIAAGVSQWMSSLFFETHPLDPASYLFVAAAVVISVVLAGLLPAIRASRIDAVKLLKQV